MHWWCKGKKLWLGHALLQTQLAVSSSGKPAEGSSPSHGTSDWLGCLYRGGWDLSMSLQHVTPSWGSLTPTSWGFGGVCRLCRAMCYRLTFTLSSTQFMQVCSIDPHRQVNTAFVDGFVSYHGSNRERRLLVTDGAVFTAV